MYTCPVCGYDRLRRSPDDDLICPSCGTQFGYTDAARSHAELRRVWIAGGKRWFSTATPPPPGWNATMQVERAGFGVDVYALVDGYTQTESVTTVGHPVIWMAAAA
jgi:hypothetical protein